MLRGSPSTLTGISSDPASAPVGINPQCGIQRLGHNGSISNVANIAVCGASVFFTAFLIYICNRRKAAVGALRRPHQPSKTHRLIFSSGRVELRTFLGLYLLTLPLQLLTTGSLLEQGSTALVVLTAIHAGVVAGLFWALLANAIVATQVVEDGTLSSLIVCPSLLFDFALISALQPYYIFTIIFFAVTTYISLDVALGITTAIGGLSSPPESLHSIPLFVLTSIWPGACAVIYLILMTYIVLRVLNETRPMVYYILSAALFILSQLAWFLLSKVICKVRSVVGRYFILLIVLVRRDHQQRLTVRSLLPCSRRQRSVFCILLGEVSQKVSLKFFCCLLSIASSRDSPLTPFFFPF